MLETVYTDISNSVEAVITQSQWLVLAIIAVIAIAQGLSMGAWGRIWGRAGQGLLVLAIVLFLWDVLDNEQRFEWSNWNAEGIESWKELMALTLKTLLGYYIVMLIAIGLVHLIKSIVQR